MQAEIEQAYQSAKALLEQLRNMNARLAEALDRKGEAEINLASIMAVVTKELEQGGVSKTALKGIAQGDPRVLEAQEKLTLAKIEVKKGEQRVSYVEKSHDLEKKRMSAEMEEAKRLNLN